MLSASLPYAASGAAFENALVNAADSGETSRVRTLLSGGEDANAAGKYGVTPLMRAAYGGHLDVMSALLKAGAKTDAKDVAGETALHLAARNGRGGAAKKLLEAGAQADAADAEGWTPLMRAVASNQADVAELLLTAGKADPLRSNEFGDNAYTLAAASGDAESTKLLFSPPYVASLLTDKKAKDRVTDVAREKKHAAVVDLLEQSRHAAAAPEPAKRDAPPEEAPSETAPLAAETVPVPPEPKAIIEDVPAPQEAEASAPPPAPERKRKSGIGSFFKKITGVFKDDDASEDEVAPPPQADAAEPYRPALRSREIYREDKPLLLPDAGEDVPPPPVASAKPRPPGNVIAPSSLDGTVAPIASDPSENRNEEAFLGLPSPEDAGAREEADAAGNLFYIQFGTYAEQKEAIARWEELREKHSSLQELYPKIVPVYLAAPGTVRFRLRAGAFGNDADASRMCKHFTDRNVDCLVVESAATADEMRLLATMAPVTEIVARGKGAGASSAPAPVASREGPKIAKIVDDMPWLKASPAAKDGDDGESDLFAAIMSDDEGKEETSPPLASAAPEPALARPAAVPAGTDKRKEKRTASPRREAKAVAAAKAPLAAPKKTAKAAPPPPTKAPARTAPPAAPAYEVTALTSDAGKTAPFPFERVPQAIERPTPRPEPAPAPAPVKADTAPAFEDKFAAAVRPAPEPKAEQERRQAPKEEPVRAPVIAAAPPPPPAPAPKEDFLPKDFFDKPAGKPDRPAPSLTERQPSFRDAPPKSYVENYINYQTRRNFARRYERREPTGLPERPSSGYAAGLSEAVYVPKEVASSFGTKGGAFAKSRGMFRASVKGFDNESAASRYWNGELKASVDVANVAVAFSGAEGNASISLTPLTAGTVRSLCDKAHADGYSCSYESTETKKN